MIPDKAKVEINLIKGEKARNSMLLKGILYNRGHVIQTGFGSFKQGN